MLDSSLSIAYCICNSCIMKIATSTIHKLEYVWNAGFELSIGTVNNSCFSGMSKCGVNHFLYEPHNFQCVAAAFFRPILFLLYFFLHFFNLSKKNGFVCVYFSSYQKACSHFVNIPKWKVFFFLNFVDLIRNLVVSHLNELK